MKGRNVGGVENLDAAACTDIVHLEDAVCLRVIQEQDQGVTSAVSILPAWTGNPRMPTSSSGWSSFQGTGKMANSQRLR